MSGPYVIRCLGRTGRATRPGPDPTGLYLSEYDPEAHDGQGTVDWTGDISRAAWFTTANEATALWLAVPRSRPTRPDGQPNRPLSAFSVEVIGVTVAATEDGR